MFAPFARTRPIVGCEALERMCQAALLASISILRFYPLFLCDRSLFKRMSFGKHILLTPKSKTIDLNTSNLWLGTQVLTMTWFSFSMFWRRTSRTSSSSVTLLSSRWLKTFRMKALFMPFSGCDAASVLSLGLLFFSGVSYGWLLSRFAGATALSSAAFSSFSCLNRHKATTPCDPSPSIFKTSTGFTSCSTFCVCWAPQVQRKPPSPSTTLTV